MITAPTVTAREGKGPDSDATSGFIVAPTLTAGWGTNRGAPGNGGKDDAALAVIASTLQGGGRRGHRVDAEGAAGGQLIAFDAAQITSGENRANPQPGDPTPTLAAQGQPMLAYPLDLRNAARSSEAGETAGTGIGEDGDPCFTISATSRALPGVATFGGEGVRDALTAEGADASEDGTGRGTPIVTVPMAFNPQTGGSRGRLGSIAKPTALQANQITGIHTSAAVRRLTPRECERLQGLPDDWTRWLADGSEQSDSARYREIGNSVAVPCVEWIARRIVAVDASLIAANEGAA